MVTLPGFTLKKKLYEGTDSLVYRAAGLDNRPVVLKVLRSDHPSPQAIARFQQEYSLLRELSLPGVIQAYDQIPYEHTYVIVCEDFGGEALSYWMGQWPQLYCPMETAAFLGLAIALAEILGQLHSQQVTHRDINPGNIVLNPTTGQIKLIDFGIATRLPQTDPNLVHPKYLEGTLAYLSPEQTGRMNRSLDYRTDFYSLGVTFYHLLTGQLPFPSSDTLELVHCHLAKPPTPPAELNPTIPAVLSKLILKLMAKDADDRYQSAGGIQADLERCLELWQTTGTVTDFSLASQDFSGKLQIAQKLYGRELEVAQLLGAFERISASAVGAGSNRAAGLNTGCELLLITGYAGIGKSSLVRELYRPMTQRRGYFISGKFDQYHRDLPYSAIVTAFGELVRHLLGESDGELAVWCDRILAAVGANGRVITEVLPEIERIIGVQPPVPPLGALESQNRFQFVFQNFVRVFCTLEHPLTLFLDDLQWVDAASLALLHLLLTDDQIQHLLVLGAYRNNEVNRFHPLTLAIESLHQVGVFPQILTLTPLGPTHVGQLLADTLHQSVVAVHDLMSLVMQKTTGNPFFINQFLKTLHSQNLLTFDQEQRCWRWDVEQINAVGFTDNVVVLLLDGLRQLPQSTQRLLKLAACIGTEFAVETLEIIAQQSWEALFTDLTIATQSGLLMPMAGQDSLWPCSRYRFTHDQVQQAAYELIDIAQRQQLQLQIGRLLLQQTPQEQLSERLFAITDHFNLGLTATGLTANIDATERERIAELNLQAGVKAKTSLAYDSALAYLRSGLALLGPDPWQNYYPLALTLHEEAAEAAYLSGSGLQMEHYINTVLARVENPFDRIRSYDIKMQALASGGNIQGAIQIGLEILDELGIFLPYPATLEDMQAALENLAVMLRGRSFEALFQAPQSRDPHTLAAGQILTRIAASAYIAAPRLLPIIIHRLIEQALQNGNTPASALGYVAYGLLLCGKLNQIETGYRFGQLALQLQDKLPFRQLKTKILLVFGGHIAVWKDPLETHLPILLTAYESGVETGDFEFAGYALNNLSINVYFSGRPLEAVVDQLLTYAENARHIHQEVACRWLSTYLQAAINLTNSATEPALLVGTAYDETLALVMARQQGNLTELHHGYLNKLILHYLMGDYTQALLSADQAKTYVDAVVGMIASAMFYFYDALVQLAGITAVDGRKDALARVDANLQRLRNWATHAPMKFQHKVYLVEAEKARVLGQILAAEECYEQAIAGAQANQYRQEEALAFELAAKFYLARGCDRIAKIYLQEAQYTYHLWGATAKVKQLERAFPEILTQGLRSKLGPTPRPFNHNLTCHYSSPQDIDLQAIMRATQAIAGEIAMPQLLSSLMTILMENVGADRGYLAMPATPEFETDDWYIEAIGRFQTASQPLSVEVLQHLPLAGHLPLALVNTVLRCRESIVLDDAAQAGEFVADPYLQTHGPRSLLCAPLLNSGVPVGLIYLENNLTPGAFTDDRLEIVKLLSGQAAIAIHNAKLYGQLQDRTAQLKRSEQQLKQFLDAIPVGVSIFDLGGRIAYQNTKARALQGMPVSTDITVDQLPEAFQIYKADSDQPYPPAQLPVARALKGETVYVEDMELRQYGHPLPLEVFATPILNELGEVLYAIAAFSDITERKHAQRLLSNYNRTLEAQVKERTDALTQQWEMLQTLVDYIPVMLAFYDAEGSLILGNRALQKTLGWSMMELAQTDWLQEIYPNPMDRQRAREHWGQANGTWLDTTILCRQGNRIDTSWAHIRLSDGRIISIGQDISDRKRMEASLRSQAEEERLLSTITQHIRQSLDLSQILSTTTAELQRNLKADRVLILKFTEDGMVRVIQSVSSPEYGLPSTIAWQQDCAFQACYQLCLQGKPRIYNVSSDLSACAAPFMRSLGVQTEVVTPIIYPDYRNSRCPHIWGLLMVHACESSRWWQDSDAAFLQQISNQLAIAIYQSDLYYQLQTELKERRQTEAALRQSQARLTTAQTIARLGNWELMVKTGEMIWSEQLFELSGLPQLAGAPNYDDFLAMCHPEDRESLNQHVTAAATQGTPYRTIFRFIRPDGTLRHIESRGEAAIDDQDQVSRVFGVAQDISERYEIDRIKDEFIGIVSHELRTPMTAIQSSLMMLSSGAFAKKPEQAADMLRIAQTNTDRLVRLVNDILDLERLEAGEAELMLQPYPIADLIKAVIETLQPLAAQNQIQLVWHPHPATVYADPDAIIQTLTNLVSNAIKFSHPGGHVVLAAAINDEVSHDCHSDAPQLQLSVTDQGRGIPANKLESIFNRFQQVDALDSRKKGGTGLGLAICKKIVAKHGGQIWAESVLGEGSTFFFTLPLVTTCEGRL